MLENHKCFMASMNIISNSRSTYLVCIWYPNFTTFRTNNVTLPAHLPLSVRQKNCPLDRQLCLQWKIIVRNTVKMFTCVVVLTIIIWIIKNSKELVYKFKSQPFSEISSIKTLDIKKKTSNEIIPMLFNIKMVAYA